MLGKQLKLLAFFVIKMRKIKAKFCKKIITTLTNILKNVKIIIVYL